MDRPAGGLQQVYCALMPNTPRCRGHDSAPGRDAMGMTFRAFVAVDLDEGFGGRALLPELEGSGADLKLVEPRNIHLTLKFLGETDEALVDGITEAMRQSVRGVAPFEVRFHGLGAFPNRRNIRVVWVGVQGAEALVAIAGALEDNLAELGFEKEGRFSPHATLGRLRSRRSGSLPALLEKYADTPLGKMTVRQLALKKSVLDGRGPTYSTVRQVELVA